MSAAAPTARPRLEVGPVLLIVAGMGVLLLRLRIPQTSGANRIMLPAVVFTAILVTSLLLPVVRGTSRVQPWVVGVVGLAGVGAAALSGGRPVAAPLGPWSLPLAVVAAVAEEALFRRAAYGQLERYGSAVAVVGSAIMFAAVHLPFYGLAAFPVDLGAGLLFSWQRWASGTWTPSASAHAAANVMAVAFR